jgi:RNA-directed DNA polymerase
MSQSFCHARLVSGLSNVPTMHFNTIPHGPLQEFLQRKIVDERFLKLIGVLIKAPILQDGIITENTVGCPQGSIISPVLSNIYLHHVIDEWFDNISKSHLQGKAKEIRFADDMAFVFHNAADAAKFYGVLPKRLSRYGIEMHAEKSQMLPSGNRAAARANARGEKIPVFHFLGFTCYWSLSFKKTFWRLKVKSRSDRKSAKLKGLRKYLRENLNAPQTSLILARVKSIIRGWARYHAVSDNGRQVNSFIHASSRILWEWFNRRGGRKGMSWERFKNLMTRIDYPSTPPLKDLHSTLNRAKA